MMYGITHVKVYIHAGPQTSHAECFLRGKKGKQESQASGLPERTFLGTTMYGHRQHLQRPASTKGWQRSCLDPQPLASSKHASKRAGVQKSEQTPAISDWYQSLMGTRAWTVSVKMAKR